MTRLCKAYGSRHECNSTSSPNCNAKRLKTIHLKVSVTDQTIFRSQLKVEKKLFIESAFPGNPYPRTLNLGNRNVDSICLKEDI